jgi:hypothetical protein
MGKIFLVEPARIVRQAVSLFLSAANEVRAEERIPDLESQSLEGCDLLIVDRAELRDRGEWTSDSERVVRDAGLPIIWLDEAATGESFRNKREKALVKPLEREAVLAAVAAFFSAGGAELPAESSPPRTQPTETGEPKAAGTAAPAEQETVECIDLVDAVEEERPAAGAPERKPD